jgi:Protein of unknown function (DUF1469).
MNDNIDIGTIWNSLKKEVSELIATRIKILRFEIYEKTSVAASALIFGVIIINLIFFTLLFAFVALGFLFSEWLGNYAGGFGLVVLIYVILFAIMLLLRKKLCVGWKIRF